MKRDDFKLIKNMGYTKIFSLVRDNATLVQHRVFAGN